MADTPPDSEARMRQALGIQRHPNPLFDLFIKRDFLSPAECAGLIMRIDADVYPSQITDPGAAAFRNSETCDLSSSDPFVAAIEQKISQFAGIDRKYGEPLQGQRYIVGQEFKPHTDYFDPEGPNYQRFCGVTGNRTWTFMVYLNTPKAGGATRFLKIGKIIQPETGKMIAWHNRLPSGVLNDATIHEGMKVRAGSKYIITKWFRSRPWR